MFWNKSRKAVYFSLVEGGMSFSDPEGSCLRRDTRLGVSHLVRVVNPTFYIPCWEEMEGRGDAELHSYVVNKKRF